MIKFKCKSYHNNVEVFILDSESDEGAFLTVDVDSDSLSLYETSELSDFMADTREIIAEKANAVFPGVQIDEESLKHVLASIEISVACSYFE